MEEKRYLKWYNKVGYGSGDIAGNVVYAFLTSFVMIYLTDTIGLSSGIVGTLIAVSKLFDGFTDIFFGSMIDKTHSRLGKARPWMIYGYIGCAITLVACFAVPIGLGKTAQYAWFFIAYTLLNGVFYTANTGHKEQQRTCADGILSFHLRFLNKPSDSVYYSWICWFLRWRCSSMAKGSHYLCSDWIDSKYHFWSFRQRTFRR